MFNDLKNKLVTQATKTNQTLFSNILATGSVSFTRTFLKSISFKFIFHRD